MAIVWAESFEHYGIGTDSTVRNRMLQGLWAEFNVIGLVGIVSGSARTGAAYFTLPDNTARARRVFGTRTVVGLAFGIRFPSLPSNNLLFVDLRSGSNLALIRVNWRADGAIAIYQGAFATLLFLTDQVLTPNTWHHVEILATISTTVGRIEIKVDGNTVALLEDLNLGSTEMAQVAWTSSVGAENNVVHLDDIVVHTGEIAIGPARVITGYPAGDGSPFGWTAIGAATGWECVDETVPDGDTTYIGAGDVGDKAVLTMPTLPADVAGIIGIFIPTRMRQEDAGITHVQVAMLSGSESAIGAAHSITTAYSYYSDAFSIDPDTGGQWNKASFEAAQLQIERTV